MTTKKKEHTDRWIVITGIIALAILEIYALSQGINGTLFSLVILLIGLAIGVTIPFEKVKEVLNTQRYINVYII